MARPMRIQFAGELFHVTAPEKGAQGADAHEVLPIWRCGSLAMPRCYADPEGAD